MLDPNRSSLGAEFAKHPIACLTLASYLPSNTGDVARKYIKDPELLSFIDIECYCWSTVLAEHTPMINAGMVSMASLMPGVHPNFSESCRISCHFKATQATLHKQGAVNPGRALNGIQKLVFCGGRAQTKVSLRVTGVLRSPLRRHQLPARRRWAHSRAACGGLAGAGQLHRVQSQRDPPFHLFSQSYSWRAL